MTGTWTSVGAGRSVYRPGGGGRIGPGALEHLLSSAVAPARDREWLIERWLPAGGVAAFLGHLAGLGPDDDAGGPDAGEGQVVRLRRRGRLEALAYLDGLAAAEGERGERWRRLGEEGQQLVRELVAEIMDEA